MITLLSAVGSLLSFRLRSRASLELELVALRHQVTVLRRQRPGRPWLFSTDRLLWVWLYRTWPQVLNTMVLVKPATVLQWHRKGFRLYWRRRSRHLGRPKMSREIRDLIRKMSLANPLWGAPRIHGELLKLGFDVSQATVGRYLPVRPKVPSPTWRSFLHNHLHDTAAVDMFLVVTAKFQLLYALVVLGHERRTVIHFDVTQNPTQVWLARQITEAFPLGQKTEPADTASRRLLMIIAQKPTQSLAALYWPLALPIRRPRKQQDVTLPLMIPLDMEMVDIVAQRPPQRALAKEDHLGQALLLDRSDPALRIGIQVRAARRQREWVNPT